MEASLKARIITSAICLPVIILALVAPEPIITFVVMVVSCIGLYEYYKAVGLIGHPGLCIMGYVAAVVISMGANFSAPISLVMVYVYVLAMFVMMLLSHNKISVTHIGMLLFGLLYIPYFLSHIVYIRSMEFGRIFIWLVFIGAFVTDTCAYFVGKSVGRHKLCPNISPKKTVEGAIGGVLGAGVAFVLFGLIVNLVFSKYPGGGHLSLWLLFVLGIIAAVVSEIGDLTASAIKRQFNIKDFGTILPGHGGILDRCDSIILVAPTVFLFLYNVNIVVV